MTDRRSLLSGALALLAAPGAAPAAAGRAPLPLGDSVLVGMRYQTHGMDLSALKAGARLLLRREPSNARDPNAIAVHAPGGPRLGYLPARDAPRLAAMMDAGAELTAELTEDASGEASGLGLRLAMADAVARPALPAAPAPELAMVLRAAPLLAEYPDGKALMICGPALGWRRSTAGRWWPPGPGDWPEFPPGGEGIALRDGTLAMAVIEAEAMERGMSLAPAPGAPPWQGARKPEGRFLRCIGTAWVTVRKEPPPAGATLSAQGRWLHWGAARLAAQPAGWPGLAARLEEEGLPGRIVVDQLGACRRPAGGWHLPLRLEIAELPPPLRGAERAALMAGLERRLPARLMVLPAGRDLPALRAMARTVETTCHLAGLGRLDEAQAMPLLRG